MTTQNLAFLVNYLAQQPPGPLPDVSIVAMLLANSWDELEVEHNRTKMSVDKLSRMEMPIWQPPRLQFVIERHGAMVAGGSGRA